VVKTAADFKSAAHVSRPQNCYVAPTVKEHRAWVAGYLLMDMYLRIMAEQLRERAHKLRHEALGLTYPPAREAFLNLADEWERLARQTERDTSSSPNRSDH
jgi:hypothetical protein